MEVGAGIGSNTLLLRRFTKGRWLCIEPDPALASQLAQNIDVAGITVDTYIGPLRSLSSNERFDCVLYIDVLEHIADDAGELTLALSHLASGGHLAVLAPANEALFSPFDRTLGHFRRYSKSSLLAIQPEGVTLQEFRHLDSVGLLLLALNRAVLRSSLPTFRLILLWDRVTIPISRVADRVFDYRIGKSILAVWRKD